MRPRASALTLVLCLVAPAAPAHETPADSATTVERQQREAQRRRDAEARRERRLEERRAREERRRQQPARRAEPSPAKNVTKATLWALLPGGGHFYLGDPLTGATYAALTGAFLLTGAEVERRNDELGRNNDDGDNVAELNVPYVVGQKIWEYSIYTTFREALKQNGVDLRANGFDDTPTSELLLAPFHPDQWLRPAVFGAGLLGLAGAWANAELDDEPDRELSDVERVYMMGSDFDRDDATLLYGASSFGISMGAGLSEEALFRGILQTVLQDRWGNAGGLWAASAVFGLAHLPGGDGDLNVGGALWATAAGAYLGWLYNHDGNRLAAPVAAHFWYDFLLIAGTWAFDPEDNALGFDVKFSF